MIFSRFTNVNLFLSMYADCSVPLRWEWGHKVAVGQRRLPWSSARSQSDVTRMAIKILIKIFFSIFEGTDLSRSMLANCFLPQRRDRGTMGRRRPPWLLRPLLKISYCWLSGTIPTYSYVEKKRTHPTTLVDAPRWMVKFILITITKPSLDDTNLLCNMLADCCLPRRREWGTIAAVGWQPPPWLGCIFLPSFHLANCMSGVCRPQNQQKPNHCPTKYLHQYLAEWDILSIHPLRIHGRKMPVPYGYTAPPSCCWRC